MVAVTTRALPHLTSTGDPGMVPMETATRRALDQMHAQFGGELDALTAASIPFAANAADWVAPAPTTVQEALRRLAAAAGAHPVP